MLSKKLLFSACLLLPGLFCFAQDTKDIKWINSNVGNYTIKIEPHTDTLMTPNLALQFSNVSQMLRQNIPWMIPGKINVEVYQDKKSFLIHNRGLAEGWSGAFFDPDRNLIAMYDEPDRVTRMMKKFTHELTHLFVENTFNPPNSKAPRKEPPVWLNEGLAVNMEDIAKTPHGGGWHHDLVLINIFSSGEHKILQERKKSGNALSDKEKQALRSFAVTDKIVFFQNFAAFMEPDSYDKAVANGKVNDWYLQAYAMVRFLFEPGNSAAPAKYMQFKQFMELLVKYSPKKDKNGKLLLTADGKKIMARPTEEEALKTAYRYKNVTAFEEAFWDWLTKFQLENRKKLKDKKQKK